MPRYSMDMVADDGSAPQNMTPLAVTGSTPAAPANAEPAAPVDSGWSVATPEDLAKLKSQTPPAVPGSGWSVDDPGFLRGVWDRTIGDAVTTAKALYTGYRDAEAQAIQRGVPAPDPAIYVATTLGKGLAKTQLDLIRKGFSADNPATAIGYLGAALIPIAATAIGMTGVGKLAQLGIMGMMTAPGAVRAAEDINAGQPGYGIGELTGVMTPYAPDALGGLAHAAIPARARALTSLKVAPEMRELADFAAQHDVPMDVPTLTQNPMLKYGAKAAQGTLGGGPIRTMQASQADALGRVGAELSSDIGADAARSSYEAGSAVDQIAQQKIAQYKAKARTLYRQAYGDEPLVHTNADVPHIGLSDDLLDRVMQPDGGFTYNVVTGDEPKSGYAVSIYPERTSGAIDMKALAKMPKDQQATFLRAAARRYIQDNRDLLTQPGNYLGPWHDPDTGQLTFDVSRVVNSPEEAAGIGRKFKQKSYFDFEKGHSYPTGYEGESSSIGGGGANDEEADRAEADILSRWAAGEEPRGADLGDRQEPPRGGNNAGGAGGAGEGAGRGAGQNGRGTGSMADEARGRGEPAGVATMGGEAEGGGPSVAAPAGEGGPAPEGPPPGMRIPADMRKAKRALQPIFDELTNAWTPTLRDMNPAYTTLKNIINGPDWREASALDRDLSVIKGGLRKTPAEFRGRADFLASKIIKAIEPPLQSAVYKAGGPEAYVALQQAREATKTYSTTQNILKQIRKRGPTNEPVTVVNKLTAKGNVNVELLKKVAADMPEAIPHVARAWMERQLRLAQNKGIFNSAVANTIKNNWEALEPETKQILFGNDGIKKFDQFFRLEQKIAENVNPSGTGPTVTAAAFHGVTGIGAAVGEVYHYGTLTPLIMAMGVELVPMAVMKLLYSNQGSRLLTNWMRAASGTSKLSKAAFVAATVQLLNELHADASHADQTDQPAENATAK